MSYPATLQGFELLCFIFLMIMPAKFCKSSPLTLNKGQSFKEVNIDAAPVNVVNIDAAPVNKNLKALGFFEKLVRSSSGHLLEAPPNAFICIDLRMHNYILDDEGIDIPPSNLASSFSPAAGGGGTTNGNIGFGDGQIRGKSHLYPLLETIGDAALRGYQFSIAPASNRTRGCFERRWRWRDKDMTIKEIPRIIHQSWKVCNNKLFCIFASLISF